MTDDLLLGLDVGGTSTRADFFERFVNIFEGPMTQMEDRVASSYLLTNPGTTPARYTVAISSADSPGLAIIGKSENQHEYRTATYHCPPRRGRPDDCPDCRNDPQP